MSIEIVERLPGVEWTATSLQVIDPDLSFDQFAEIVRAAGGVGDSARWWLGDILVYGEARFGEEFAQALSQARVSERTLTRYRYVAAQVDPIRRRPNLSFSHHTEVAACPPDVQNAILARAEEQEWSVAQVREKVQDTGRLDRIRKPKQDVLDPEPIVSAVAGLGRIREALGATYHRLKSPDAVDALTAAEQIGPALRALDAASETVTAASKVVDLRGLAVELLQYVRPSVNGSAYVEVPKLTIDRIRKLVEGDTDE